MTFKCKQCGIAFEATDKRRKFCTMECCQEWRKQNGYATPFKKGRTPWNKGTVGVMKPNSGSFKKGQQAGNWLLVGTEVVRYRTREGRERTWVKVTDNGNVRDWKLRSVATWEEHNGPLEQGLIIHHIDSDAMNDHIDNLVVVDRAGHLAIHRPDFEPRRNRRASEANRRRHSQNRLAKAARASS